MKKLLLAVAALVALASSALATPKMECSVNDPTGTPLNVRNGTIVGALANGTPVFASEMSKDGRWVKIAPIDGNGKAGWAFFNFVNCD